MTRDSAWAIMFEESAQRARGTACYDRADMCERAALNLRMGLQPFDHSSGYAWKSIGVGITEPCAQPSEETRD